MATILIIDSDPMEQSILSQVLSDYSIESALTAGEALQKLQTCDPDIILLDTQLKQSDGTVLLSDLCGRPHCPPVIVFSAESDTTNIVRAVKNGAYSFISKPYEIHRLVRTIEECIAFQCFSEIKCPSQMEGPEQNIIGSSSCMQTLKKHLRLYADSNLPVLITGESGSGKELVAQTLHQLSPRNGNTYRIVHCGAIPLSLFESELYGSESGACTGAVTRAGYFEQAHRGTLFMDEIGEMPLAGQVKLLRILEDREIIRVGGHRKIRIDVRVVSATNRKLPRLVEKGKFRSDLLYRINTLHIHVPPLRDHIEDIPQLSRSILNGAQQDMNMLSREAVDKLMNHSWPGNVRELKSVLARATVLAGGKPIEAYHLRINHNSTDMEPTAAIS